MSFYWMAFLILLNTINKGISVGFSNELSYDEMRFPEVS